MITITDHIQVSYKGHEFEVDIKYLRFMVPRKLIPEPIRDRAAFIDAEIQQHVDGRERIRNRLRKSLRIV